MFTWILKELYCDGDTPLLSTGNAPDDTSADARVGHVFETHLYDHPAHLKRTRRQRM